MSEFIQITEALVDQAVLGKQVDDFWRSDVGQYIRKRANEEIAAGIAELRRVDPRNGEEVARAQDKVNVPERAVNWIEQAIREGIDATAVLERRQFEDDEPE